MSFVCFSVRSVVPCMQIPCANPNKRKETAFKGLFLLRAVISVFRVKVAETWVKRGKNRMSRLSVKQRLLQNLYPERYAGLLAYVFSCRQLMHKIVIGDRSRHLQTVQHGFNTVV